MQKVLVLGIDLAASERRPTGLCALRSDLICDVWLVYADKEIVEVALNSSPEVVTIDAPLSFPKDVSSKTRLCDRELLKRGVKLFPPVLGPMKKLTERAMALSKTLSSLGLNVIEVLPGGAQDVLGLPRKGDDLKRLVKGLRELGLKFKEGDVTGDEADAITCALIGLLYLEGRYEVVGDPEEGVIVMPAENARPRPNIY